MAFAGRHLGRAAALACLAVCTARPAGADAGGPPPARERPPAQVPASRSTSRARPSTRHPESLEVLQAQAAVRLRHGDEAGARRAYARLLARGWSVLGGLAEAARDRSRARDCYRRAHEAAPDDLASAHALAVADLRFGDAAAAVAVLEPLASSPAPTTDTVRLLTQALVAEGRVEEAVRRLEEAHRRHPADAELMFLLGAGDLRLGREARAADLFERVARARPGAATLVLIGRTYRDAGAYDRARRSLQAALRLDPRARRAHYYLATTAVLQDGMARLDEAIAEFSAELALAPNDPLVNLRLGMALVEAQRPADALPHLRIAADDPAAPADAWHYLGRCQLALDRPAEAVIALERALALSAGGASDEVRLLGIHYQLAVALRAVGRDAEASEHFREAEQSSARRAETSRQRLARYLSDTADPAASIAPPSPASVPYADLSPARRAALGAAVAHLVAQACFNLGVMDARARAFDRAAAAFEAAAAADPRFPDVQYARGVACFNDGQFACAEAALEQAYAADPQKADVRPMLAMSAFAVEHFDRAAALLASDPGRPGDPARQLTYAVALVQSGKARQAEAVFSELLGGSADSPELHVVLGLAQAEQGDFDAATEALNRALALRPTIGYAHGALAVIALKRGELEVSAREARAELGVRPEDVHARHVLATVLDLQGHADAALTEEQIVLRARPDFADAHYLAGKILLARGDARGAIDHLETAAREAPEAANVRFQLANAYRRSGQEARADQELEAFRRLKDRRRAGTP